MIRTRLASSLAVIGLIAAVGSFSTFAQDPTPKKPAEKPASADKTSTTPATTTPAPVVKKKTDPSRRVPDYFGQIGLSNEQRESIYKIRKTHQEKIDALRKQITEADAKSMTECEAVLTDVQKKLLENLRAGSGRGAVKAVEAPAKTKS